MDLERASRNQVVDWNHERPEATFDRNQIIYYEPLMDTIEHECLAAGADNMQRILL